MDDIRNRFRTPNRSDYLGPIGQARPPKPQPSAKLPPQPVQRPKPQTRPAPATGPIPQREPVRQQHRPASQPRAAKRSVKRSKKFILAPLILLLLVVAGFGGWTYLKPLDGSDSSEPQTAQTAGASTLASDDQQGPVGKLGEPLPQGRIRLVATGTFAAYDSINAAAKRGASYDYLPQMKNLKPIFSKSDINFCHQETLGSGADEGISGYPYFNAPTQWSQGLIDAGCNVINMSSFHTYDKTQRAINKAVSFYDGKDSVLAVVGANRDQKEQDKIRYFEKNKLKFAVLSYTTRSQRKPAQSYGVNMYSEAKAKKQVAEAKENADFVIVGMTWGKVDSGQVQPEQKNIAKVLATAGADLIIGGGSHVLQTVDVIKGGQENSQTLVYYDLGNAVNSQLPIENLIGGVAVVDIDIQSQDMIDPGILPVYQHYEWSAAEKASNNFDARRNFGLYVLDQAAEALAKSQNNTTVDAQTKRVKNIVTQNVPIKVLTSKDFE